MQVGDTKQATRAEKLQRLCVMPGGARVDASPPPPRMRACDMDWVEDETIAEGVIWMSRICLGSKMLKHGERKLEDPRRKTRDQTPPESDTIK